MLKPKVRPRRRALQGPGGDGGRARLCGGGAMHGLAVGPPEGGTGVGGLFAGGDGGDAAAAGLVLALVDPEVFFALGAVGGAAERDVGGDVMGGEIGRVALEEFAGGDD